MTEYFQQNGQGADGSMSAGFFAKQGISLISVNAPMNSGSTPAPLSAPSTAKPL
jgi:hypothetical protein